MKPAFFLGQRLATERGFGGRVESVFISAYEAFGAQISHRRVRLSEKLAAPSAPPHRWPRLRIAKPFPDPDIHYFLVEPGGRIGAFVAERCAVARPSRSALTKPRYGLGRVIVDPYGFIAMITAIHRRLASAIQCGVISPGWFEVQERRPVSRLQPFYGCTGDRGVGAVLVGEAEVRLH